MHFFLRSFYTFLIISSLDTCWLFVNLTWKRGVYYWLNKEHTSTKNTVAKCFLVWVACATYVAGHDYDTSSAAFYEGFWLGFVIYTTFNATASAVTKWPDYIGPDPNNAATTKLKNMAPADYIPTPFQKCMPLIDTLWGSILLGLVTLFSHLISN